MLLAPGAKGFLGCVCVCVPGLGWEHKMLGGSKCRLPRAIRWSKRNFFITEKLISTT